MEHADKVSPDDLKVELFGKEFQLALNMGTLIRFQQKTGKNPFDIAIWLVPTPFDVTALFWALIGGDASGYSFDQVAEELGPKHAGMIMALLAGIRKRAEVPEGPKADAAG
jgi:hypothetical protein